MARCAAERGLASARAGAVDGAACARGDRLAPAPARISVPGARGAADGAPLSASPPGPRNGELWITVLDVGQGLAVVARTEKHALLYDAGPAVNAFSDSGSRVILPYLRGEGIHRLDALVVSHDDRDHSGGAGSVLEAIPVGVLWSSLSPDHPLLAAPAWRAPCLVGRKWFWDGASF